MAQDEVMAAQKLVVIGGSAGGLAALLDILPQLLHTNCAILIVLHRRSTDVTLTDLLTTKTSLKVKDVDEKDIPQKSTIYIAPGDYHLLFEADRSFSLDYSEKVNYSRPSIDVVFQSAANVFKNDLACILLSGANSDGTEGLRAVRNAGGLAIAQLPSSSQVPFMPSQAIKQNVTDYVMDIHDIANFINGY